MKTTKVIEIELCDVCNNEINWHIVCVGCEKQVCSDCSGHITVRVIESTEYKTYRGQKSFSTYEPINLSASYCPECKIKLRTTLITAGFKLEKEG